MRFLLALVVLTVSGLGDARAQTPSRCGLFDAWWDSDVHFELKASRTTAEARARLPEMVDIAERVKLHHCCPDVLWSLHAHVDRTEVPPDAVEGLAQMRAEYVQTLLTDLGVPKNRICARSFGARQPILAPPNKKNARVEIHSQCDRPPEANKAWC